jgi:hypothetical protein
MALLSFKKKKALTASAAANATAGSVQFITINVVVCRRSFFFGCCLTASVRED